MTLPEGYRDILRGTLLDGREISSEQLENVRSNLQEQLRVDTTALCTILSDETRIQL